jgi:diguanylate cyclase (GGDEF)-like protein
VFMKQHRLHEQLKQSNEVLQDASMTDPLTGVRNRRFFSATIEGDVAKTLRAYADGNDPTTRDLVFYLVDADDFKEVNDRHGHDAGDRVLVEMSRRISSAIRNSDVLVRWGGEEFLIVSRYTDRREAEILALRVMEAVGEQPYSVRANGETMRRTCSVGWAAFPWVEEDVAAVGHEEVINLADRGLQKAKTEGKNRAIGMTPSREGAAFVASGRLDSSRLPVLARAIAGPVT